MGKVIDKFAQAISGLSHSEKHVIYYIERELEKSKNQSLTEMARENSVSTTTIVRMCHKLGLDGFSELRYILKTIEEDDLPKSENIISRHVADLQESLSQISLADVQKICQMMVKAEKVIIVAVGLSKMMGEYFSKLLMQVNKPTLYAYESHIIDLLSNISGKNDLVIFISSSGETKTIVNVAEKLLYQNRNIAAITNSVGSTLTGLVPSSLASNVQRVTYKGYDLTSRSSLVAIIDILFEAYLVETIQNEEKS